MITIEEMQALEKETTRGPWTANGVIVCSHLDNIETIVRFKNTDFVEEQEIANAKFVAEAREFVPKAISELKLKDQKILRLESQLREITHDVREYFDKILIF